MDQVLTKPFSLDALDRALLRWLPPSDTVAASTNGHGPDTSAPTPAADAPVVDLAVLRGIVGDDDDAVRDVLTSFSSSTAESLRRLDAAIAAADPAEIGGVAHRILAGARTVGAKLLTATCERVDAADDDDRIALAPALHHQLLDVIAAIASPEPVAAPE